MKVSAPDGEVYRVRRRWLPWRRRGKDLDLPLDIDMAALDPSLGDDLGSIVLGLVAAIVIALLAPIILVFLITGVEFVLLLALLPFALAGRMLFGHDWTIEVRHGRTLVHEEAGGTWTQSGKHIVGIAAEIRSGRIPAAPLLAPVSARHRGR